MPEPMTWREKQAARPDPTADALDTFHRALSESSSERDAMEEAIGAYEDSLTVWRECDEPGCSREAGCGWPTEDGGYRRTCWKHATGVKINI